MTRPLPCLMALVLLAASPAMAGSCPPPAAPSPQLDELYDALKREPNAARARRIAADIRRQQARSGSATVDLLLARSREAASGERHAAALDLADQVVVLQPQFAEGWNQRATVHLAMNRVDKALADLTCVLHLEPRHFAAWTGMALLWREFGEPERAFAAYMRALEAYPADREAQGAVAELAEELADRPL